MKAKELIARLEKLVAENGDLDILVMDSENAWFNTIKDAHIVQPNKYNALMSPGIELEDGLF